MRKVQIGTPQVISWLIIVDSIFDETNCHCDTLNVYNLGIRSHNKNPFVQIFPSHKLRTMKIHHKIAALLHEAESRRMCACKRDVNDYQLLKRKVGSGLLIEPLSGYFIRKDLWESLSYHEQCMYPLRAACHRHPDWVLCGVSAAAVYDFSSAAALQRNVHILASRPSQAGRHGHWVIHYYGDCQHTQIDGIRVTRPMRTIFDCIRTLDFTHAIVISSMGLRELNKTTSDLERYCEIKHRKWGVRRALFIAEKADPACENGGEAQCLAAIMESGFSKPLCQREFTSPLDGQRRRVDFYWQTESGTRIAGELDGREKYLNMAMTKGEDIIDVTLREKDRETELNLLGVRVIRFQMHHVYKRELLKQRLEAAKVPKASETEPNPFKSFKPRI